MKTKPIEHNGRYSKTETILKQVETLPYFSVDSITSSAIAGEYTGIALHRLVRSGKLLSLRRGLYISRAYLDVLEKTGKMHEYLEFLVPTLYPPSYISGEYVLAERGILTEATYAFTGITKNKTKRFSNTLATIHYHHVKEELFCGFEIVRKGIFLVHKATVAKALFDFLYVRKNILSDKSAVEALRLNIELLSRKEKGEVVGYCEREGSKKMRTIITHLFT